MGLGFSESDSQWSYSGFTAFRRRLAAMIGVEIYDMETYGDQRQAWPWPRGTIPWSEITDDIVPFLNHPDCDGELSVEEMKKVAPRLRVLVADWLDDHDKVNALKLAEDMDMLVARGEPLKFI